MKQREKIAVGVVIVCCLLAMLTIQNGEAWLAEALDLTFPADEPLDAAQAGMMMLKLMSIAIGAGLVGIAVGVMGMLIGYSVGVRNRTPHAGTKKS